ncbi:hypothetical protein ACFL60_00015 [Candidatus Omnitrophota bacterium]
MLKKCLFLFSISSLLFVRTCYASPAYGTHMPEEHHWTGGLEGNFIIDRNLDNDQGGTNGDRYFLTLSYGIFSWLSFDGKIGVGNVEWHRLSADDLTYSTNFAGAYGFRIKGYENKEWGIKSVMGFQHISVHPEAKNQASVKHEAIIDEWQGSFLVSKDIGSFVPYMGGRYGSLDFIRWENEKDRERIHSERYYGAIVGMDWWLSERTKINIEASFIDSEELAMGISYDF